MERISIPQITDAGAVRGMLYALRGKYRFLDALPVGRSVLGREIFGMVLGSGKERVLFAGAFHAQEWMTALVLLRLCEDLCAALQKGVKLAGVDVRAVLMERSLLLVPMVNPDGVEIALHGAGAAAEYAVQVGEQQHLWQANARGVDINHNFPAGWEALRLLERAHGIDGPAPRQWCGPAPGSEPETAAMMGLCQRSDFCHVVALHTQGEEIYWRYGANTPPAAFPMAQKLGAAGGYTVADPEGLASHGGFKDWFIESTGRPGFTLELGKGENPLPIAAFEGVYTKAKKMLLTAISL